MESVFYERYAKLCRSMGGTPNSVAKEIGVSSGSITAWKNGAEPRYSTVVKIADYFDTTADYLLGRTDDPENDDRFGLEDPSWPSNHFLYPQYTKTPTLQEEGRRCNVIKIAGRNGSYEERVLTDEQLAAVKGILSQLPDASGDL